VHPKTAKEEERPPDFIKNQNQYWNYWVLINQELLVLFIIADGVVPEEERLRLFLCNILAAGVKMPTGMRAGVVVGLIFTTQ